MAFPILSSRHYFRPQPESLNFSTIKHSDRTGSESDWFAFA